VVLWGGEMGRDVGVMRGDADKLRIGEDVYEYMF